VAGVSGNDTRQNLTAKQLHALGVLLTGGTAEQAATAARVTLRTLRRWQARAEFQDAQREFARNSFRDASTQLLAAQAEAVQVLWQAMRTGSQAEKIRAARTLLELGLKAGEDDREERLKRLEDEWRSGGTGKSGSQNLRIV
jgi:hypothetical protein